MGSGVVVFLNGQGLSTFENGRMVKMMERLGLFFVVAVNAARFESHYLTALSDEKKKKKKKTAQESRIRTSIKTFHLVANQMPFLFFYINYSKC